jgi:hypothetical protein
MGLLDWFEERYDMLVVIDGRSLHNRLLKLVKALLS